MHIHVKKTPSTVICYHIFKKKDTDNILLWLLANLEEARGDNLPAIGLYKLVLKHYHPEWNSMFTE